MTEPRTEPPVFRDRCGLKPRIGPVIRADEQLVIVVEQPLVFEGLYKNRPPRIWQGSLEIERKVHQSYDDILAHVDSAEQIRKVLRVCMSTGCVDDITFDVLEAAGGHLMAAE